MKKSVVVAIIIAVVLIIVGAIMAVCAGVMLGKNFFKVNENEVVKINDDFSSIDINANMMNVWLMPAGKDNCRIEYSAIKNMEFSANVVDGVLKINISDNRRWYDYIGIVWPDSVNITVYVPAEQYETLSIKNKSGDIHITRGAEFDDVNIDIISGDVEFFGKATDNLYIKTTSGDITLSEIKANTVEVETTSGDIEAFSTVATQTLKLSTTSGDIEFASIDAPKIQLNSVSGDIEGSILTEKRIEAKTTSGDIEVRSYDSAKEICNASTVSGDIEIKIR